MTAPAHRTALITGATSGIGREFATQLAAEGWALILVARDTDRLPATAAALRDRYGGTVETLAADLARPDDCARVEARITDGDPIDLLVNNAGFGIRGAALSTTIADEEEMLAVNVRAVLRLTHAAVPGFVARGRGGAIVVSSMASLVPTATGPTYAASKAWTTMYYESLALSLAGTGVTVTALCPGFTRTEFHARIGSDGSEVPGFMWLRAADVVRQGLADHRRGKVLSIPGRRYRVAATAARFVPRRVLGLASRGVTNRRAGSGT